MMKLAALYLASLGTFVEDTNIAEGSELLTKVYAMHDSTIVLKSIEILNP
jgi:hypothetical protein